MRMSSDTRRKNYIVSCSVKEVLLHFPWFPFLSLLFLFLVPSIPPSSICPRFPEALLTSPLTGKMNNFRVQQQEVPGLDYEVRVEFLVVKHFPSSLRGNGKALKQQIPWSKQNFKNALKLYPIRGPNRTVDVQCFSRPFDESHRPRRKYPS